jgi:exodeoxyribonuclease-3
MRLLSWNVNGLRALLKKGFVEWLQKEDPDILGIQETKARPEQLPKEFQLLPGWEQYYSSSTVKKGYSGVALLSKPTPQEVGHGFGTERFDQEGRTVWADYGSFVLYTIYFPNGKASEERLRFKMDFYDAFLEHAEQKRAEGKGIVVCGDVNTAHQERDLARPKDNEDVSGFLPEEREWMDKFVEKGYHDTFRIFHDEGGHYSWWSLRTRARERNVGWRLDYFFVSDELKDKVKNASILDDVQGSDHAPVALDLDLDP